MNRVNFESCPAPKPGEFFSLSDVPDTIFLAVRNDIVDPNLTFINTEKPSETLEKERISFYGVVVQSKQSWRLGDVFAKLKDDGVMVTIYDSNITLNIIRVFQ